jgi:hypothetical protein
MSKKYDILDISTTFNKTIKKLITIINNSIDNNILFDTIKRRTSLIIKSHPLFLLEEAGPQIFQYRDFIKNESEELFLQLEDTVMNNDQMQDYIKDHQNDKKDIVMLLGIVKSVWFKYSPEEKKIIQNMLKVLLSEYCKYLTTKN